MHCSRLPVKCHYAVSIDNCTSSSTAFPTGGCECEGERRAQERENGQAQSRAVIVCGDAIKVSTPGNTVATHFGYAAVLHRLRNAHAVPPHQTHPAAPSFVWRKVGRFHTRAQLLNPAVLFLFFIFYFFFPLWLCLAPANFPTLGGGCRRIHALDPATPTSPRPSIHSLSSLSSLSPEHLEASPSSHTHVAFGFPLPGSNTPPLCPLCPFLPLTTHHPRYSNLRLDGLVALRSVLPPRTQAWRFPPCIALSCCHSSNLGPPLSQHPLDLASCSLELHWHVVCRSALRHHCTHSVAPNSFTCTCSGPGQFTPLASSSFVSTCAEQPDLPPHSAKGSACPASSLIALLSRAAPSARQHTIARTALDPDLRRTTGHRSSQHPVHPPLFARLHHHRHCDPVL